MDGDFDEDGEEEKVMRKDYIMIIDAMTPDEAFVSIQCNYFIQPFSEISHDLLNKRCLQQA